MAVVVAVGLLVLPVVTLAVAGSARRSTLEGHLDRRRYGRLAAVCRSGYDGAVALIDAAFCDCRLARVALDLNVTISTSGGLRLGSGPRRSIQADHRARVVNGSSLPALATGYGLPIFSAPPTGWRLTSGTPSAVLEALNVTADKRQ